VSETLGETNNPAVISLWQNLCLLLLHRGQPQEALNWATQCQLRLEHRWDEVLSFTSIDERLSFQSLSYAFELPAALAETDCRLLAQAVLRLKSVVLTSVLEEQRLARTSLSLETREVVKRWREARNELLMARLGSFSKDLEQ